MKVFDRLFAWVVHFIMERQLDYFVSKNKKVFDELAKK
jgi:hypothetical protein